MKKLTIFTLLVSMAAALFSGCCPCRKGKNNLTLEGHSWHLVQMMNHELKITPEQFVFTFAADGTFSGIGACNRIFGKFNVTDKGAMTFENMASTKRMCPDAELEVAFNKILSQTTHYEIDYDMLMLIRGGVVLAVFKSQQPKQ
jgi:heat shock protein HslJ